MNKVIRTSRCFEFLFRFSKIHNDYFCNMEPISCRFFNLFFRLKFMFSFSKSLVQCLIWLIFGSCQRTRQINYFGYHGYIFRRNGHCLWPTKFCEKYLSVAIQTFIGRCQNGFNAELWNCGVVNRWTALRPWAKVWLFFSPPFTLTIDVVNVPTHKAGEKKYSNIDLVGFCDKPRLTWLISVVFHGHIL